jgi:hypothetical protein
MLVRKVNAVTAETLKLVAENAAGGCQNVTVIMSDGYHRRGVINT